jgi:hypothetical protein
VGFLSEDCSANDFNACLRLEGPQAWSTVRANWICFFSRVNSQDKPIDYFYASHKSPGFQYYNGIRLRIGNRSDFGAPALGINQSYITAGTSLRAIIADVVNPFA